MKIHYQCSNCGKRFVTSPIPGVPEGMYISGCRAVGDAIYCEECVATWADRNGADFDEQYKDPKGMFIRWWNRTVDKQCTGAKIKIYLKEEAVAYAEKTSISVAKTKADIEELVQKHGANQFVSGYKDDIAVIGFSMAGRQIRFLLPLPDKQEKEFLYTPGRGNRRTEAAAHAAWEQACRSRWRALYLIVKAKLEAVDAGISTVEREFLYDIVLPDGRTAGEWLAPQIEAAYQNGQMPPMLPMLN